MSYDRFLQILRSIRFDDKSTRSELIRTDKLAAIRTVLDSFTENCKTCYNPGEFITIDEKLEPFRGRCNFIQYIPNKLAKYGIKIFALCDAKTFFTSNIEVYCGKQPDGPFHASNKPLDIVERLVLPFADSNRNLTTDNWYTCYPLGLSLLKKGITIVGTLRKDKREIPPQFLPHKDREIGSSIFGYQKDFTLVSYVPKRNKSVVLLSTMHDQGVIDNETEKPEVILDYNMTKGGVDTVDQLCATYTVSRVTRRWPLVLFYALLNVAGINAYVIFKANLENRSVIRREFLKNLALQLMKPLLIERSMTASLPSDIKAFLQLYKPPEKELHQNADELPMKKRSRCVPCGRSKNKWTQMKCNTCQKFVCRDHSKMIIVCEECGEGSYSCVAKN